MSHYDNHQLLLKTLKELEIINLSICLAVISDPKEYTGLSQLIKDQHEIYDRLRGVFILCDVAPQLLDDYDKLLYDLKLNTLLHQAGIKFPKP